MKKVNKTKDENETDIRQNGVSQEACGRKRNGEWERQNGGDRQKSPLAVRPRKKCAISGFEDPYLKSMPGTLL